ncbi:uncharacterized protein LOC124371246 [Homalodisca vitripennis]|uniref:uncharacterized protein LOC124371246 n=1 Tax=Homalodisca vitripennis TaxID=197043 RepID=UPI001EEAF575|nr:uncharacterized protein LOC124371246 [Homalodisca vitripennis]
MHSTLQLRPLTARNLEAGKALCMLMALCLLPAERIQTGLRVIRHYLITHGLLQNFRPLLMYMENTWMRLIGPETFSVFGQCHRTNNALEGFYSRLLQRMGPHPGVWQFHGELRAIESAQYLDYRRVSDGIAHVRPIRRAYRRQNTTIFLESERLVQGTYNEAQFLDIMSNSTRGLQQRWGVVFPAVGDTRPAVPTMPPPLINQEPTDAAPAPPAASATIPQPAAGAASTPARRPTAASATIPQPAAGEASTPARRPTAASATILQTGRRSSLYSCPSSYSCVSRSPSRRSSYNSKRSRSAS